MERVPAQLEALPIPLLAWYAEHKRTLPWRSDPTAYHVLVSEIMLQQTRVAAVLGYYRRFLEALPTVEDLAAVEEERLFKLWQGLGYYNRARNLHRAAKAVVEEYGGTFPRTVEGLRSLPGVGEYTAGAIASIAFGLPVSAVDGNVLRVVSRLTGDPRDVSLPGTRRETAKALEAVLPRRAAGEFNQALMDLGAMVCLPGGTPLCEECPAAAFCAAHREGKERSFPVKPPKKERRIEERTVFLLFYDHRVALRRREEKGLLSGLWEFPGLPGSLTEPPFQWGLQVLSNRYGREAKHIFTHVEWHMTARLLTLASPALPEGWVWADRADLEGIYALPSAFSPFRPLVEERL